MLWLLCQAVSSSFYLYVVNIVIHVKPHYYENGAQTKSHNVITHGQVKSLLFGEIFYLCCLKSCSIILFYFVLMYIIIFFFVLIRVQLPLRMVTALMEIFIKMKFRVMESCVVWVDLRTVESGDIARWTDKLLLQTQFSYNCLLFNHKQQNHPLFASAKWKTEVIEIVSLTELVSKLKVFSFSHSGWFMGTRSTLTEQRKISINVEFLLY